MKNRSRLIDLVRKRFGRLVVRAYEGDRKWSCDCDCGACVVVFGYNLQRGFTKSCGCRKKKKDVTSLTSAPPARHMTARRRVLKIDRRTTHGMIDAPEYVSWRCMKQRCCNPRHPAYDDYGGRGISICERWKNSFEEFFADMGPRPEGCSLHRIDPNGNYEPGNCCWSDAKQQRRNQRPRRETAAMKRRQAEPSAPPFDNPPPF